MSWWILKVANGWTGLAVDKKCENKRRMFPQVRELVCGSDFEVRNISIIKNDWKRKFGENEKKKNEIALNSKYDFHRKNKTTDEKKVEQHCDWSYRFCERKKLLFVAIHSKKFFLTADNWSRIKKRTVVAFAVFST